MDVEQIIRIIEACPEGTHLTINISAVGVGVPNLPDPILPPPAPPTRLVEITQGQACIRPVGKDATGKPIMEHTVPGFRVEIDEVYQVEFPPVVASGGSKYYKIWKGAQEDYSRKGWYILKDNTKAR